MAKTKKSKITTVGLFARIRYSIIAILRISLPKSSWWRNLSESILQGCFDVFVSRIRV